MAQYRRQPRAGSARATRRDELCCRLACSVLGWLLHAGCAPDSPAQATQEMADASDPVAAESDTAPAESDVDASAREQNREQDLDAAAPGPQEDASSARPEAAESEPEGAHEPEAGTPASDAGIDPEQLPYARSVVRFAPGEHAGFGQERFPDIVLGPPDGKGNSAASLDVLSLGVGGEIVLGFGERELRDAPGPDLIVFENPFWPGGDARRVFAEPGEVALSADGENWSVFPCDPAGSGGGKYPGCAGWTPSAAYDPFAALPPDPAQTGGDAFDMAELGLSSARFVRIRDLSSSGAGNSAGFDLDAVALIHYAP
jgi:hypothetical protein